MNLFNVETVKVVKFSDQIKPFDVIEGKDCKLVVLVVKDDYLDTVICYKKYYTGFDGDVRFTMEAATQCLAPYVLVEKTFLLNGVKYGEGELSNLVVEETQGDL